MRRIRSRFVLFVIVGLTSPTLSMATESSQPRGTLNPAVQGELVKMEDKIVVVKDQSGKERWLNIDQDTAQIGVFRQGAYVQAWVLPNGRTESIIAFRTNRDSERELTSKP